MEQRVGNLSERIVKLIVHFGLIVTGEPPVPDVTNDTNNLHWVAADGRNPQPLSDRVLAAECVLRQSIVNHHDEFVPDSVIVIEKSAAAQRNSHYVQIIRRHS